MLAKLYCVTSADKTNLNGVYFQVTCTFELVAIWPIALIGRLRFLFLSLIFLIRTSAESYFCLAPLLLLLLLPSPLLLFPSSPPPSSCSPPPLPPPPTSPVSAFPLELLELNIYFYLDTQHEIKTQQKTDIVQSERGRVEWKKVVFPCHNNQNTWRHFVELLLTEYFKSLIYQKKILSSKAFLFVKNQTLNKALLAKIHRPTKNITPTVAHRGHAIHFLNSILSRDKRETC